MYSLGTVRLNDQAHFSSSDGARWIVKVDVGVGPVLSLFSFHVNV